MSNYSSLAPLRINTNNISMVIVGCHKIITIPRCVKTFTFLNTFICKYFIFYFQVISLNKLSSDLCYTECGDGGCRCVKNVSSIVDQLYVASTKGDILSCICGDFQVKYFGRYNTVCRTRF